VLLIKLITKTLLVLTLKLVAEIVDADLLFKLMHVLGATFWRNVGDELVEVVYFSGEKMVHFKGKLSEQQKKVLEGSAWKVENIEVNEVEGTVKIKQ